MNHTHATLPLSLAVTACSAALCAGLSSHTALADVTLVEIAQDVERPDSVTVQASWLPVIIQGSTGDVVRVEALIVAAEPVDGERVLLKEKGDGLLVKQDSEARWRRSSKVPMEGYLRIALPPGIPLTVDTASGPITLKGSLGGAPYTLSSASGDIDVDEGLKAPRLTLSSASGDVHVAGWAEEIQFSSASGELKAAWPAPVGRFEGSSASGDITALGGAGAVRVSTTSGDVTLDRLAGPARVDSVSGTASLTWISLPAESAVRVSTVSGEQRLIFPEGSSPSGAIETLSGEIQSAVPVHQSGRSAGVFVLGGPEGPLDLTSVSGGIEIQLSP